MSKQILSKATQKQKIKPPKRNRSAFILFSQDIRPEVKKNSGLNSNLMMEKLAGLWKELDPERKEFYQKLAAEDKERYQRELQIFSETNPGILVHNKTTNNYVKKPCSAYAIFMSEKRQKLKLKHPNKKMADILQMISPMWKGLTPRQRKIYQQKAQQEKELTKQKLEANKQKENEPKLQKKVNKSKMPKQKEIPEVDTGSEESSLKQVEVFDFLSTTSAISDIGKISQFCITEICFLSPESLEPFSNSPFTYTNSDCLDMEMEEEFALAKVRQGMNTIAAEPNLCDLMNFDFPGYEMPMTFQIFEKPLEEFIHYNLY